MTQPETTNAYRSELDGSAIADELLKTTSS